ncbi:Endocytosis protein end4, partial [Pichia kudriavzevii]
GQYDNDQLMLQSYDQKVQALENELASTTQTAQEQLASKDEQLNLLQEQVEYWKNKYESLAKLYSQLRTEHLNLLTKSKKIQQKAASAQEAIEKREKLERDMKAKNIELADLIKERDRARLELERFKNGTKTDLQTLQLEKDELEQKLATLDRAQSANLTAIFNQHNKELQELQNKFKDVTLNAPSDEKLKQLEEQLQEKDLEIEMMQQTMDETIKDLVKTQNSREEKSEMQNKLNSTKVLGLIDAILKSGINRIQDAVFELDSPMQAGNLNSSPEYVLTLLEKSSGLVTDFASSFNNMLVDGDNANEALVIDSITNFTTSISDILLNTKGLTRLTKQDDFQDDLIDTAKDIAEISEVYLESLYHLNLVNKSIDDQTDIVINGNIDVQEILQTLLQLVESMKTPSSKIDLSKVDGELSDLVDEEMEHASRVIEEASVHLSSLLNQPFDVSMSSIDIEVNKSILAAASAIITAIKYLIRASIESQEEIVNNGRGSHSKTSFYKKNNKWTEGLISASKSIAYSTNTLIRIADGVLQNKHSNEELVVASREVAASTAQLVSAARVKSQFMSKTQNKLEDASKKVNLACKQLVDQVNKLIIGKHEVEDIDYSKLSIHENKTAEMEQQVEILKLENALSSARKRLGEIRKFSYKDDDSGEE